MRWRWFYEGLETGVSGKLTFDRLRLLGSNLQTVRLYNLHRKRALPWPTRPTSVAAGNLCSLTPIPIPLAPRYCIHSAVFCTLLSSKGINLNPLGTGLRLRALHVHDPCRVDGDKPNIIGDAAGHEVILQALGLILTVEVNFIEARKVTIP